MEVTNKIKIEGQIKALTFDDFVCWFNNLDISMVDANPITFQLSDFEAESDFVKSLFLVGRYLLSTEDIVVRYSKPYTEDKTDVIVCFQILRSKAKMFFNYLKNSGETISCILSSNKDIKEAVKFFNSIGVKGEEGVNLLSKEIDYTSILKDVLDGSETKSILIRIAIEHDEHNDDDYPMLIYDFIDGESNFNDVKTWVKKEILKITD